MPTHAPFSSELVTLRKTRVAAGYGEAGYLHTRAAEDIAERLEAIPRRFERVLALGGGTFFSKAVNQRPQLRERMGVILDQDAPVIEPEQVALGELKFDLMVAPLGLHWTNDLPGVLVGFLRALAPDGLLLASLFGGETLMELRLSLIEAEAELTGGAAARVSPFVQLADLAALVERAGFALPAADIDRVIVRYADPIALIADLRAMGETSALAEPAPPLRRAVFARAMEIYRERFADDDRVRATFDILTLTGWAPHQSQQKPLKPGSARARLADALGAKEESAGAPAQPSFRSGFNQSGQRGRSGKPQHKV